MCTAEGPCPHRGFPSNADPDFENISTQIYIYTYILKLQIIIITI